MADGWIELFDVETDEVELLLVFDRFEPVDYGCGVFSLVEVVFFRDCAVDAHQQHNQCSEVVFLLNVIFAHLHVSSTLQLTGTPYFRHKRRCCHKDNVNSLKKKKM